MSDDEHIFTELIRDYVAECLPHAEQVTDTFVELERCWSEGIPADDLLPGLKGTLHTLKGNSAMMGFTPLQALAHALEDVCARCTSDPASRTPEAADLLVEGGSLLIDLIRHAAVTPPAPEATGDFVARVGRLLEAPAAVEPDRRETDRREGDRRRTERRGSRGSGDAGTAVRIDFRLLDTMLEIFGESMIDHAALHDAHRRLLHRLGACPELSDLDRTLLSLDSTMKRFENALMRTRMLPVSTVFGRFTRLVRDVARSEGKRVRLVATGGETLLDKTVLDRLGEPLVHLLTNAIVHGIESEADRIAAGKPAEASLVLRAAPISDRVVITVSDNGRGLDVARIQAKAEALGLAAGGDAEQLSNLIFRPGFSTTDQVSTLAGRGVGLDVVAQSIRELGGTIEIRNVPGQGVTFVLGLPLTLAIVKSLIVEVDQERYAVPLSHVVETARVDPAAIHDINRQGVTIWRGHPVAVTDGGVLLGSPSAGEHARSFYLVITSGGRRRVILVDRLIGYQDVVVKGLDPALGRPDVVSGAAILGDGRVACILDPVRILDQRSAA